jgi:hypothetical protein
MHRPDAYPSLDCRRQKRRGATPQTLRISRCLCCDTQVMHLRMQTGAAHRQREGVEMNHIRSLRLKLLPVTGLVPLCSNYVRSNN